MLEFKKNQASLIDWMKKAKIGKKILLDSLKYDTEKTVRLEKLNRLMSLPINLTHYILGEDFNLNSPNIQKIIKERGQKNTLHAFRIFPKVASPGSFDVIKKYGLTWREFDKFWKNFPFDPKEARIRVTDYRNKLTFSAIIIVGKEGIVGEAVRGDLYNLTYGSFLSAETIVQFYQEYGKNLQILGADSKYKKKIKEVLNYLKIRGRKAKEKLIKGGFSLYGGFVGGYYEYVEGDKGYGAFTDMNGKIISNNINIKSTIKFFKNYVSSEELQGMVAFRTENKLKGKIEIVRKGQTHFKSGNILVTEITSPNLLHQIKKARAVITQRGGIMSHAAIVSREFKIPTIVGVKKVTTILKSGMMVEIDFNRGLVSILKK